jgi:hypothetical protein
VPPWRRLSVAQLVAIGVGLASIGIGLWHLVVVAPSATRPIAAVAWLAGVLIAHDVVLAPAAVVVGTVAVRLVPAPARRWVAAAALVLVCLVLVAAPGVLRP